MDYHLNSPLSIFARLFEIYQPPGNGKVVRNTSPFREQKSHNAVTLFYSKGEPIEGMICESPCPQGALRACYSNFVIKRLLSIQAWRPFTFVGKKIWTFASDYFNPASRARMMAWARSATWSLLRIFET
jgi:hypothetical protein